ncbi:hypothetical protein GCK72_015654 [Caenorhabditis remanei]|uniref:DUF7154 domain-containing protein n=1 Tax=Caenorhabditis remanei TaxID=31234 RepID=A0A6A5GXS9_CAERE|nr:hypothetical protein GCK72_015654 [Caenorhabditis remanei]KAF1759193.1 hypothetical protein GCK72_015654 [Caenorhabditis remanei]
MYKSSFGACVHFERNISVLYAYSTEIDQETFWGGADTIAYYAAYYKTANVRFDTEQEEEIEYHTDRDSFNASVRAHPPNLALGYGDTTTGSNLYNILKKFLNNKKVSICGTLVFIAVKRYPDEADVSDIISQLRANHVMVHIAVDDVPSGGSNPSTLFEMSSKTNRYCVFGTGNDLRLGFLLMVQLLESPFQVFAQNLVVSGSGRIELPTIEANFPLDDRNWMVAVITFQDHKLDNNFVSINYTIASVYGSYVFNYPNIYSMDPYGTGITDYPMFDGFNFYKWIIDYHYNTDAPQVIECRMYSRYYHDFLPLPDFRIDDC